jgi:hypothetical protein
VNAVMSREMGRSSRESLQGERDDSRGEPDEAVDVLRGVWTASGHTSAELDELFGPAKSCKNMQNVGFEDFGGSGGDLRAAWRATLEREGKLSDRAGSIRDLMLGPATRDDR